MNSFNWGVYNDEDRTETPIEKVAKDKPAFNWGAYEEPTVESADTSMEASAEKDTLYQKYFKDIEKTPEELKNMSVWERMGQAQLYEAERLYRQRGAPKSLLSTATLGFSEKIPGFEVQPHETGGIGTAIGTIAPYAAVGKVINWGLKGIQALKNLGKGGQLIQNISTAAATGATVEAGKQTKEAVEGKGFDIAKVAEEGAIFGGLAGATQVLFESGKAGYEWLKGLNTAQRTQVLTQGQVPQNLTPTSYKKYQNEVVPELQKIAEEEYAAATEEATKLADTKYEQQLANTQAKHERELQEIALKKTASQEEIKAAEEQFENKMKQLAAEHQTELEEIEKANEMAAQEFQEANQAFENTKRTQEAVEDVINREPPTAPKESLKGRVSVQDNALPVTPKQQRTAAIKDKVGDVITAEKIQNTYDAGFKNTEAVKATDQAEYRQVRQLYKESEELNASVNAEQPQLANELHHIIDEIKAIPQPSPPQEQLLKSAQKTLDSLILFDEEGAAVGFKEVNNQVLLEQAKALRHSMDYTYAHGDSRGIFTPMVDALQDAVESGARSVGNAAAVEANQEARTAYREWAKLYENPLIKRMRNSTNHQFSKTFENSLNVDDYLQLDKVLSKTNAGQQLSKQTKRALVDKELSKFYKNPKLSLTEEFNETLKELEPVLTPEETRAIKRQFDETVKEQAINFNAKAPPQKAKRKEITSVRIPQYKKSASNIKEPSSVTLPKREALKPTQAMKVASKKMKITPEQVISKTDTPTGWNEIKTDLQKTQNGQRIFEEIGQEKVADMLYGGKVRGKSTASDMAGRLNEGKNFNILCEIIGEPEALDLIKALEEIGQKELTIKNLKKHVKKATTLKAAIAFGIF